MPRPRTTPIVFVPAIVGAGCMFASLFFDWYELRAEPGGADLGKIAVDGWSAFEFADVALVVAALVVIASLFSRRAGRDRLLLAVGALATIVVVLQVVKRSPQIQFFSDYGGFDSSLATGPWVALAGCVLILIAGALELRRSKPRR